MRHRRLLEAVAAARAPTEVIEPHKKSSTNSTATLIHPARAAGQKGDAKVKYKVQPKHTMRIL
jgi:hypothetical protein